MNEIDDIYIKARDGYRRCKDGLLRIDEAKSDVEELWSRLYVACEENSDKWRIVDKAKPNPIYSTLQTTSKYAESTEIDNYGEIIKTIEKIRGKKKPKVINRKIKENNYDESKLNQTTGRTEWDFLSELHRKYKLGFILVAIILLVYLGWP